MVRSLAKRCNAIRPCAGRVQGFLGCFVDGNASNPMFPTLVSSNVASVQACVDAAATFNLSYVAMQSGIVCKGSMGVPDNATRASNGWLDALPGECSDPCTTSTTGYPGPYPACGNAGKSAVYDVLVAKGIRCGETVTWD